MVKKSPTYNQALQAHLKTKTFQSRLRKYIEDEISNTLNTPIEKIISKKSLESILNEISIKLLNTKNLSSLSLKFVESLDKKFKSKKIILQDLIHPDVLRTFDSIQAEIVDHLISEEMLGHLLKSKLSYDVLVQIIHQTIVTFYKKINPLFGGLATQTLDKQIRAFIGIFIPQVQDRIKEFLMGYLDTEIIQNMLNQALEFTLNQNISSSFSKLTINKKEEIIQKVFKLLDNKEVQDQWQNLFNGLCMMCYENFKKEKLGSILHERKVISIFSKEITPLIMDRLKTKNTVEFLAQEAEILFKNREKT